MPEEKIPTQKEWRKYLSQDQKTNPVLDGYKYLKCLEEIPGSTYKEVANKFNISKARVSQMIALVTKLPKEIVDFLASKNESEHLNYFTERKLRPLTLLESDTAKVERFRNIAEAYKNFTKLNS